MQGNGRNGTPPRDRTRSLEALLELVAGADNPDPDDAAREDAWAHALRRKVDAELAALRRRYMPARPSPRCPAPISDEIRALPREGLIRRLEILRQSPYVQVAHLDLSGLTNDDLRLLLAELEAVESTPEGSGEAV
jgi:hypothetical protein